MKRSASRHRLACMGVALLPLAVACSLAEPETSPRTPTRRELMRRYWQDRRLLVVYGASHGQAAPAYEAFARQMASDRSTWSVSIQSDRETSYEDLGRSALYLIGTVRSNRWIARLEERLPIRIGEKGFGLLDETYGDPTDVLRLLCPNPASPGYPLFLIAGNSDEQLPRYLKGGRRGDFHITREGRTTAMGWFKRSRRDWVVDPKNFRVFESPSDTALVTGHFVYTLYGAQRDSAPLERLALENESLYRRVAALGGDPRPEESKIHCYVYPDSETKGLVTDNIEPAHYEMRRRELHLALGGDERGVRARKTVELLLHLRFGEPARPFVARALATYVAQEEAGAESYMVWAARLHQAGEGVSLLELLDEGRVEDVSDFIVDPLAGSFAAFVLHSTELDLVDLYSRWSLTASAVERLDSQWKRFLDAQAKRLRAKIELVRAGFPDPPAGFQRGFTHAHVGYQIYNGYLSKRSDDALAKLASMGIDSVAIVPYTFMRDPHRPAPLPVPRRAGSENDEGVIHAIRTAQELGMAVMLKPQIWMHGSWTGEIRMSAEEDRRRFFEHYYRWIRHYALMAERCHVEILCVGVELRQMTVGQEALWIDIFRRLRRLYSGRLVYAANWDGELDRVRFWDHLDYIGVNAYYPLSQSSSATDEALEEALRRALGQIKAVHERYKKPVLVTEIGFTSTPAPWRRPHERDRSQPVSLKDQARCYETVFRGLKGASSCIRGLYWWKWPSDLEHGGRGHTGFTPNNKPAEEVVRKWYAESW